MNKVTTINLTGNAYQLEEAAYELLNKYLAQAKAKLAKDPDKDEILADFEQAIADKCAAYLHARKTVITETEVKKIIADMGPVEAEDDSANSDEASASETPKRLYLLSEGSVIAGVCTGLSAYFNVDSTIIRLIFVLMTIVSHGLWILVYLLLVFIIPQAKTPEEKAAARGEKFNAQEVLGKAKQKYAYLGDKSHWQKVAEDKRPALHNVGEAIIKILRIVSIIAVILLSVIVGFLTILWVGGLWWIAFGHLHLHDQLSTISLWNVAAGMTAVYFVTALPLMVLAYLFRQFARRKQPSKQHGNRVIAAVVLWLVAFGILCGVGINNAARVDDYVNTHGYVKVDNHHRFCINSRLCGNSNHSYRKPQFMPDFKGPSFPNY